MSEPLNLLDPLTGEVLDPTDLAALERSERAVDHYLRNLRSYYDARRELRAAIAALRGPAELPRPRHRTDVQARVGECPRCGCRRGEAP